MNRSCALIFAFALLFGCNNSAQNTDSSSENAAITEVIGSHDEPRKELNSADAVTAMLQKRWTVDAIQEFCISERRHNPAYQGLVMEGPTWDGEIHVGKTDFDRISWYGNISNGRLVDYSLSARRADNYWLLEIGNMESLATLPETAPDPTQPHFSGTANQ